MSTFGKLTIGAASDNVLFSNNKFGSKYSLTDLTSAQFQVTKLTAYVNGSGAGTGDQRVRAVVYSDSSGAPGTLLGYSDEVVITDGQAPGWVDFTCSSPPILTGGTAVPYHLGLHGGTNTQTTTFYYDFNGSNGWHNADTYADGPSDPAGTVNTGDHADYSIYATYSAYTPPTPSISITSPTDGQTVSGVFQITQSIGASPHHTQLDISSNGTTWTRLGAKNRISSYDHYLNTWRFSNGTYFLRARYFTGSTESTLSLTSATISFTISNAAGTTREYNGDNGDLLSTAISAAADGDTISLKGTFAKEGSDQGTVTVNKRVRIVKSSTATAKPVIRTRLRFRTNGAYCEDVKLDVSPTTGSPTNVLNAEATALAFKRCEFTNSGSSKNVGVEDGIEYIFGNGAIDSIYDECKFYDNGDWTDGVYSNVHIHGMYAQNSRRMFIVNSIFYNNSARHIQLYPNCQEPTVYKCLGYKSNNAIDWGGDVGMSTDTTLSATLNVSDTTASLTSATDWPSAGTLLCGTEYITYTGKSGNTLTGLGAHLSHAATTTCKLYTNSNYGTVERSIFGFTGNDGAGNRSATDGIIYGIWLSGSAPPKGTGNEVLECVLHDPAPLGTAPDPPDTNAYLDLRTGNDQGGFTDAGGNLLGTDPGYTDATARNFLLVAAAGATGYGPDSIQPVAVPADPYGKGMFFADVRGRWNTGTQGKSLFYSNPLERDG